MRPYGCGMLVRQLGVARRRNVRYRRGVFIGVYLLFPEAERIYPGILFQRIDSHSLAPDEAGQGGAISLNTSCAGCSRSWRVFWTDSSGGLGGRAAHLLSTNRYVRA